MDLLYEWIQNLVCYLVIFTAVLEVLPGKEYKKYIQFFAGLVLILLLVTPILKMTGMEQNFWEIYNNREYEQEKRELMEKDNYFENIDIMDFLPEDWENGEEMETDSGTMER